MGIFSLTPEEEKQLEREANEIYAQYENKKAQASPAFAQNLGNFYDRFPWVDPDVLTPTVQAFTQGRMSESDALSFLENLTNRTISDQARAKSAKTPKKKSWWERNVAAPFRRASRYAFASVDAFQQLGTNVISWIPQTVENVTGAVMSQQYSPANRTPLQTAGNVADAIGTEGMFISTDLGTLLDNEKIAGDGFFLGGQGAKVQAERARQFRGTINGEAFTLGRFTGSLVAQPGSREYKILSGLVDAAYAIAMPAVPGGKYVTGGVKYGAGLAAGKTGLRSLAGLRDWESAMVIPEKVNDFLNSRAGRSVVKRMTKIKSIDEAVEVFPTADVAWLRNVADITDEVEMRRFVNESVGVGDITLGTAPKSVEDWNISRWDTIKLNGLKQRESYIARLMANMPGRHVIIAGGSEREKTQAVKDVKNYLRLLKVDETRRTELVDKFARAIETEDGSMNMVAQSLQEIITESLVSMGADPRLAGRMTSEISKARVDFQRSLYGAINSAGDSANHGGKFEVIYDGNIVLGAQPLNTAGGQFEMARHALMLPDPRVTRRIMSHVGWITGREGKLNFLSKGQQRFPVSLIEGVANQIWKPLTLLTGGYVLRNMADSIVRMSFDERVNTGITHPLHWIMVATHKRYQGDILGESFKGDPQEVLQLGQRELAEASAGSVREFRDPALAYLRYRKTGDWDIVRRSAGTDRFVEGVAAEISLLSTDKAFQMAAAGNTVDEIVEAISSDDIYMRGLQTMWKSKTITLDTGEEVIATVDFVNKAGQINMRNVREYVDRYVIPRLNETTGNSDVLRKLVEDGTFIDKNGKIQQAFIFDKAGRVAGYNEEELYPALFNVVNDPSIVLKETYKKQHVLDSFDPNRVPQSMRETIESWNKATDYFFAELYPKREAWLNRSPVFRQFYYDSVSRLIDSMDTREASRIFDGILAAMETKTKKFDLVTEGGKKTARQEVGKYVGDAKLADKLFDIKMGKLTTNGKMTKAQVDAYAKGYALDETKRLFYNAAEKSNFSDILRVIVPFGSAWAEVTKRWAKTLSTNPEALKRVGVTVQGLQQADPDGDGKGFFYKDPNTGEYKFNYPFSDDLAPFILGFGAAVTGGIAFGLPGIVGGAALGGGAGVAAQNVIGDLDLEFAAPVQSLSMGLSLLPGLSPYVQAAAAWAMKDKPQFDEVAKIIMPYGKPNVGFAVAPSYAKKIFEAITANPESDRIFGDLKLDLVRNLAASGKYDLTTEQGKLDLEKDAISKARMLLILQGVAQFAGPVRPTPELITMTKQGDMMASELSKAWFDMRRENPDNAVNNFLETFGEDAFLYMQSKTRALVGGLEASEEAVAWEVQNKDIFSKYPEVAGYFAPAGSETNWRVYVRLIERGRRENIISTKEFIDLAQRMVGSSLYRKLSRRAGPRPTDMQEDILREYKVALGKRYPGYRKAEMDVNSEAAKIDVLREAAFDPQLVDNPATDYLRTYFGYRDQALEAVERLGLVSTGPRPFQSKKAAEIRSLLREVGEDLSASSPEFARIWSYILYNEVDIVQ